MLDEGVLPLPEEIANKAKEIGVTRIGLEWSGGSDQGYLHVTTDPICDNDLTRKIEAWAEEAWNYSGAGDGYDYGDTLIYDLRNGLVEVSEWHMERTENSLPNKKLHIKKQHKKKVTA
jgi:hypothetical protein